MLRLNALCHLAVGIAVAALVILVVLFAGVETRVLAPTAVGLALLGSAALLPVVAGHRRLPRDPLLLAMALLIAATLATVVYSASPFRTLEWSLRLIVCAVLYGVVAHLVPTREVAQKIAALLVAVALGAAAYGMWVTLTGRELVLWVPKESYRDSLTGTFINRNHFASYLVLNLYALLGLISALGKRMRASLVLALAFGALALFLTLSRGGILAAIAAFPCFLLLLPAIRRRHVYPIAVATLLAFAALAATNWDRLQDRIEASFDPNGEPSAAARLSLWRSTFRAFTERPWLGYGAATFESFYPRYREVGIARRVSYAHNDYLEQLAEAGLVGAGFALVAAGLAIAEVRRALAASGSYRPLATGLTAGVVAIAAHAAIDFPTRIPAIAASAAVALGLVVALGRSEVPATLDARRSRLWGSVAFILLLATAARGAMSYLADREVRAGNAVFSRPAWDEAALHYERATRIDPIRPAAWERLAYSELNRAKFRFREGITVRRDLARAALEHFAEADRHDPLVSDYDLEQAWLLNFLGRAEEAAAAYDRAVSDDPANTNVLFHAGAFHMHRGNLDRALELLARAIRAWPKFFGGKVREIHRAVGDIDRLLSIIPDDQPFLIYQYAIYLAAHENDQVAADRVLLAALRHGGWRQDWITEYAGVVASGGRPEAALAFLAALPANARGAVVELHIARMSMALGRRAEAIERLVAASARFPTDRELLRFLSMWGADDPRADAALTRYRAARGGDDVGSRLAEGHLALARGDARAARDAFTAAMTLDPGDAEARAGTARSLRAEADRATTAMEARRLRALATATESGRP